MCNGRQSDPGSAFKKDPLAGALQRVSSCGSTVTSGVSRRGGSRRGCLVDLHGSPARAGEPQQGGFGFVVNQVVADPETSICCAAVGYRLDAK